MHIAVPIIVGVLTLGCAVGTGYLSYRTAFLKPEDRSQKEAEWSFYLLCLLIILTLVLAILVAIYCRQKHKLATLNVTTPKPYNEQAHHQVIFPKSEDQKRVEFNRSVGEPGNYSIENEINPAKKEFMQRSKERFDRNMAKGLDPNTPRPPDMQG